METHERQVLRQLAARWMELANLPVMSERKRLWTALKDLRPERPMLLFEVWTLGDHFVHPDELVCTDPYLRGVELDMRRFIRQVEEIGDDLVIEPRWRLHWDITSANYGVEIIATHADDAHGRSVGYGYNHPIRTPEVVSQLRPRTWQVNRAETFRKCELLNEIFGDLLPVEIDGMGALHAGLTGDLFRLIGNDNLLTWIYDAPDALRQIMAYLRDDRIRYYRWLESEGLLGLNHPDFVGSGSPGYTTTLPQAGFKDQVRLKDVWVWMESQETTMVSPRKFRELFLPDMAQVAELFGLVYYGCCEPVHDRWQSIVDAMPNIRAVSISPWCDQRKMGELLGKERVFSRKPKPWLIGADVPDWNAIAQDLDETLQAAQHGCLEIIYRDVYQVSDRKRLRKWAELVRSRVGGAFL